MTLVLVFVVGGICGAGLVAFGDVGDAMRSSFLVEEQEKYIATLEGRLASHGIEP